MSRAFRRRALALAGAALSVCLAACSADGGANSAATPAFTGSTHSQGSPTTATPPGPSPSSTSTTSDGAQMSAPPSTTTGAASTPNGPQSVTMVMSGDVLLHEGLWETARLDAQRTGRDHMDFRPVLANMRTVVSSADFAICHLE